MPTIMIGIGIVFGGGFLLYGGYNLLKLFGVF
jgi:hypothetical protein